MRVIYVIHVIFGIVLIKFINTLEHTQNGILYSASNVRCFIYYSTS